MRMLPDPAKALLRYMLASTVLVSGAMAQVDTGTIAGWVHDPSDAVIPEAQITIANMGTSAMVMTAPLAKVNLWRPFSRSVSTPSPWRSLDSRGLFRAASKWECRHGWNWTSHSSSA